MAFIWYPLTIVAAFTFFIYSLIPVYNTKFFYFEQQMLKAWIEKNSKTKSNNEETVEVVINGKQRNQENTDA